MPSMTLEINTHAWNSLRVTVICTTWEIKLGGDMFWKERYVKLDIKKRDQFSSQVILVFTDLKEIKNFIDSLRWVFSTDFCCTLYT